MGSIVPHTFVLKFFFVAHFLLPFIILGVVILHLQILHKHGSSHMSSLAVRVSFYYYILKDTLNLLVVLFIFLIVPV